MVNLNWKPGEPTDDIIIDTSASKLHKSVRRTEAPPDKAKYVLPLDRPVAAAAEASIRSRVTAIFKLAAVDVARQVARALDKTHKADIDPDDPASEAALIAAALDLSSLDAIRDAINGPLFDVSSDSAQKALAMVGVLRDADLVNQVNTAAVDWARGRAAELVGKRVLATGEVIDNPNADFAIIDYTRDLIRDRIAQGLEDNIGTPAIADSIEQLTEGEDGAVRSPFGSERAALIANTEVARANEQGKLVGFRGAADAGIALKKSWLTMGEACDVCQDNEDDGPIDLDDDFSSGDDAPPGHPNCRCVLLPETGSDEEGEGDDEGD